MLMSSICEPFFCISFNGFVGNVRGSDPSPFSGRNQIRAGMALRNTE